MTGCLDDDRAVSEGIGVAALVLLTVLVTASVGMSVLFVEDDDSEGIEAEFDFQHFSDRGALLITYSQGAELTAGNVTIVAPGKNITWDELGPVNASDPLTPGSRIQLNAQNAYGFRYSGRSNVTVVYTEGSNETVVGFYNPSGTTGA